MAHTLWVTQSSEELSPETRLETFTIICPKSEMLCVSARPSHAYIVDGGRSSVPVMLWLQTLCLTLNRKL